MQRKFLYLYFDGLLDTTVDSTSTLTTFFMHSTNLIEQIREVGPDALQYVYNHGKPYCISRLRRTTFCSQSDAEDIFMDAILIFYENVMQGKLTEVTHLQAYLYKVCQNRYYEQQQHQERARRAEDFMRSQVYDNNLEPYDAAQRKALVMQAYRYLGENCRRILHYYYFEHLPFSEIAQKMGMANANVAKVTKARCYKKWNEAIAALKLKKDV